MATFQSNPDLDPKVAQAIQDAMDALRAELLGHLKPQAAPEGLADAGVDRLAGLEKALEALDSAGTQTELLASFIEQAGAFADRSLFLVRAGDELKGWAAFGFSAGDEAIGDVTVACPSEVANRKPADNHAAGAALCEALGATQAAESILVPFALRGKVAGALYADRTASAGTLDRAALRILSYVAAQAVETLPLRRAASAVDAVEEVELETVETAAHPVVEPEREPEPEASAASAASQLDSLDASAASQLDSLDTDTEVEVDVERMIEEVEPPAYGTVDDLVAIRHDVAPTGFEPAEDEVDDGLDPGVDTGLDTGRLDSAVDEIEVETRREREQEALASAAGAEELAAVIDSPAETPSRAVEPAEVAPPADLDGPGWAFSGSESISDDTRHEEARRLARLLVTEIKLYNEEKVREGRETHDLYDQLRDDIERSRRIYEERIDDEIRQDGDYFQEEVVRILAGGDATALGV